MSEEPQQPDSSSTPATPAANSGGITQADLDRIITERLARDREAQQKKLLEALGVDSIDTAKEAIAKKKAADEAALTEQQKLQAQIEAANKRAAEAEQREKELQTRYIADQRRTTLESELAKAGGKDAKRLYLLLQAEKGSDISAVFGEGEQATIPNEAKMKALIKQAQADYALFFGVAGGGSPSNAGGQAPTTQKATEDTRAEVQRKHGSL